MTPTDVLDLIAAAGAAGATPNATEYGDDPDEGLVHRVPVPPRRAEREPLPDDLPKLLRRRLESAGIDGLWSHQVAALRAARAGEDVAIATGTASGKSLCYQLPIIERLLTDPDATALYLGPTKALTRDQLRGIRSLTIPQVRAAVIDGDTERDERDAIRRTANLVLTNPDLVHHSLLPRHRPWAEFLHRLSFVVVDEAHVARGVFGAHVGLVLRRLLRMAERYGAAPQIILTSATIGNPAEHAQMLTGRPATAIIRDGSPRGPFTVGVWQPGWIEGRDEAPGTFDDHGFDDHGFDVDGRGGSGPGGARRRSLLRETGDLLASFVAADTQTIAFSGSRKAAEIVSLTARERLGRDHEMHDRIATYRGGYLPEERRELEQRLRSGEIVGMAATNALELGIDVSGVDAILLMGWPGTFAAFHQRLGRAGRRGEDAVGVFIAGEDPLDQYLATHPDVLMGRDPEDAILDATNPYLLAPHLRCACQEAPLDVEEAARWFGDGAVELLDLDVDAGRLRLRGGKYHWTGRGLASAEVNLRSGPSDRVRIVDTETGAMIGDVDGGRSHATVHSGAIYVHQGRHFEIAVLDLDRGIAFAEPFPNVAHITRARSDTDVRVTSIDRTMTWDGIALRVGRVEVANQVTGYDVLRPGGAEVLQHVGLDMPRTHLRTQAVWWEIPMDLLTGVGIGLADVPGSLHAAEHAAIGMLPLIALCDRWDIGGLSTALHPDTGMPTVFIYDGHPGGAGLAERSWLRLAEHLGATRATIAACRCETGCPACVQSPKCGNGNDPLDKRGAIRVLDVILSRAPKS